MSEFLYNYKYIKDKILTDTKTASVVEYMLSKAISEGISTTVKFIYKKHKIIKNKRKYYSIYRLSDGKKLYGKIRYQDTAKYIIDNLDNYGRIDRVIELEHNVFRVQDKITFIKEQMKYFGEKPQLRATLDTSLSAFYRYKRDIQTTLGKYNIC